MKAQVLPGYDKRRQKLADIVPLDAPFTLFIASTQTCNFKCFYCTHSKSVEEQKRINFQQVHMTDKMFQLALEQAKKFDSKLKRVVFTGMGEPLANPNIAEMVRGLSSARVAGGYEIITNAYLLTHEMSDNLIDAGLTYLRISIQGLSQKKYKETAGVTISFDKLLDNILYFYKHKGSCKLYIKIMDACFDEGETEQQFFDLFGNMCDNIYVEHLVKAQPSMMDAYSENINSEKTFYGEISEKRNVCPYMFYTLQIDAEGNTFPCPPLGFPLEFSLGNIKRNSLKEIWNSDKLYELYMLHLHNKKHKVPICRNCVNYLCFTPKEDNLDNDTEYIIKKLEERKCRR